MNTEDYVNLIDEKPAAGPIAPQENKYIQMLDDEELNNKTRLSASVSLAASSNPDEVARQKRLAELIGAPLPAVEGNPVMAKRMAMQKTLEADTKDAPALQQKYTDLDFAKLAHDQSANLGLVERTLRNAVAGVAGDFIGSGISGMGHTLHALERLTNSKSILADTFSEVGERTKKYWQGLAPTDQSFSDQVVRGVGQMAGQLPTMIVSAPLGIAMMYGQGADQMADKIANDKAAQKADQVNQDLEILSGGVITGITEWASSKLLLKIPQANMLKSRLLNRAAQIATGGVEEGLQESMENIGQDLAHIAATNPESKVAFGEALEAGGVGAIVGTLASGVIQGALHIKARGTQKAFADLSDATKNQKLKERDPRTYQDFADAVTSHLANTADGAVENIYIDANTFHQMMTEAQLDPAEVAKFVPSIAEQLDEARVTGGDLVIPLNEFVGKIAGTEVGDLLTPHLRSAPDAVSIAEMEAASKIGGDLQTKADEILSAQEKREEFVKSANEVQKTIFDQINATGTYTAPVSRAYASMVRDFYVTQSAKMGVSPMELYEQHPYKIMTGDLSPDDVTQGQINTETPEFKNWFGDSKVVDEAGKPLVVYRGANERVSSFNEGVTFFTPDKTAATNYAYERSEGGKGHVLSAYLKMENPKVVDYREEGDNDIYQDAIDAQEEGYDGLIALNTDDGNKIIDQYMVFSPTQIKSVNNRGTWNPNDPNILNQNLEVRLPKLVKKERGFVESAKTAHDANPTAGVPKAFQNKKVVLTHWSKSAELTVADPKYHGSNHAGAEFGRSVPGRGSTQFYTPATFYGFGSYNREVMVGPHRYGTVVDGNSLYDLDNDPLKLFPGSRYTLENYSFTGLTAQGELYDYRIAQAGFKGSASQHFQVVKLFSPAKVMPTTAGNKPLSQKALSSGIFYQASRTTTDMIKKIAEENPLGFTVKVSDGSLQTSGFAVAPSKETELRLVKLTHEDLSTYLDLFQHVFEKDERAFLGGWFDSENNEFVLDVSYIVDSEKEALYLAELGNQDAIFHLDTTEEIRTNEGTQRLKDAGSYSESERDELRGVQENLHQAIRRGWSSGQTGAVSGAGEAARDTSKRGRAEGALPAENGAPERSGSYPEAAAKAGNPWIKQSKVESNKGRTLLVQFTSDLMGSDVDTASRYYDKLYSGVREGYARLEDFWEIPQWIGQIANTIPNTDVYVVRDMQAAKNFLATSGYDHVAFSSLDVTIPLIKELAPSFPGDVSIGGYANKEAFKDVNHKWYDSIEDMAKDYGHSYVQGTDYTHFKGSKVIPRLTMSQGCKYKCAFCTVPKKLDVSSKEFIDQQIQSFKDLDARLVYLNDKTFGQADNYQYLSELNTRMKEANPKFEGFIIQTTASDLNKMPVDWLKKSGIKYVELGVESYNDFILRSLHKPHNEKIIDLATAKLRDLKINLVPNIIIGIPDETAETYDRTLQYLKKNLDIISHANIYNLALYDGTELEKKIGIKGETDTDENVMQKSFHADETAHEDFSNKVFRLMTNALDKSPMAMLYQSSRNSGYLFSGKALMDQSKKIQAALTPLVAEDLRAQITATKQDDGRHLAVLGVPGDRLQAYGETEDAARKKLQALLPYLTGGTIYQSVVRVVGSEAAAVKYLDDLGIKYQAGLFYQSAWHGSPHTFDKFSTDRIGTGEGAQAYGYGLYFAGNKEVAEWYKDNLASANIPNDKWPLFQKQSLLQNEKQRIEREIKEGGYWVKYNENGVIVAAAINEREGYAFRPADIPKLKTKLDKIERALNKLTEDLAPYQKQGRLYKVELAPAEDEYLLWDKPLSEQSEKVQRAISDVVSAAIFDASKIYKISYPNALTPFNQLKRDDQISAISRLLPMRRSRIIEALSSGRQGSDLYQSLSAPFNLGTDKAASDYLHSLGIRGIKYLDGTSRGKGEGNYNYVIFSDDDVAITEMYQKRNGNKRGGFDPSRLTTLLTEQSDYSTFLHETAHFFLTSYADMASSPNATPAMQADMQTILDWFGVPDLATWNAMPLDEQRKHHEAFAYNYEIYLFEGKAPNAKMQSVFERFSAWLKKIYTSITTELNQIYRQEHGEDLPILTGEVKHVMDRMLASDNQIAQAEQVRGMAPLFTDQALSGMTDEEWAAYQDLQIEAHDAAISQHRTASLRQMKWLSNAKSKALKALQSTTQDIRRGVLAEVTEEVNNRHVYRAKELLKGANEVEALAIADSLGYSSVEDLKTGIANAPKKSDVIREEADRRMLEEYGELTDPVAFAKAVDEALHNEARARFIGVELRYLSKTTRPVRVMQEAARQAARAILGKRAIKDIRPRDYSAAEARYAAAAEKAMKKGDSAEAAQAKEHQLLQNQLAAEALKANTQVAKAAESFKRVFTSDKRLGKSRDMNYVNVARAILAHYGFGTTEEPASFYLAKIKSYDPEFFAEIEPMITAHQLQAKPFKDLTLEEFTDLTEQVQALWHISKRNKQIEIDGQLLDRKAVVEELNAETRDLTTSTDRPGYNKAMTNWQETKIKLLGIRASMRRVEAWADAMDRGKANGPFRRYIWNPISDAVVQYRMAKAEHLVKYLDLVKGVEPLLDKPDIAAPEIGYTFKPQELLHAILHTGNVSNKRKLLLGRGWATLNEDGKTMNTTNWEAFIARAQKEGLLTKEHYDFAQGVWNLLEQMKPAAQKAHRQMYGFYFAEITADPFDTPFGVYAGGYVPAVTDSNLVSEGAMRNEQETQAVDNSFMFPTTGRGFTKGRVEYNKPLLLNLGYLASHMDKVLRFTHIEPRVKDVARIVKTNKSFAEAMDGLDQTVRGDMLVPWLQRTAMQMVSMPSKGWGGKAADSIFRYLRTNAGMQMMVANVTNTLQQFTGISISALKVKPTLLRDALWQYIRQPGDTAQMAIDKSDYMKTRMTSVQYELQQTMDELLLNPTKYEKLQAFASKHGYFMQTATQGVVDTITWVGAYNQAIEQNADEKEAVRRADSAVRMTQGSFAPEDSSRIETGSPFVRAFSHFYSYFNMMANILGTEFANTARNLGVKKGAGRMFYIYAMGFMIPAVLSEMIVQAAGGFDAGDDDNYDLWDAMRLFFSAQARPIAAMVPGLGPAIIAGVNTFNSKPYDDRMSTSPAVSTIEATVRAPHSVYKAIAEDGSWSRASKDFLTGLGMITRLPLGQLGKPIGYLADVSQDKVAPESGMDVARGLLSGKDVNRKQ